MRQVAEDAWQLALGLANVFLLRHGDELTLVDAGFPGKAQVVLDAIAKLGRRPSDLRHLVFTHGHPDHIGSAAAIVRATGARTYMHEADTSLAESGGPFRLMTPGRGLVQKIGFRLIWDQAARVEPVKIDGRFVDKAVLPFAGSLEVVHAPGHCAGQVALRWRDGRLLLAGDVFTHILSLGDPVGFEDEVEGRRSQRKLARLTFDAIAFGHGQIIAKHAMARVRRVAG